MHSRTAGAARLRPWVGAFIIEGRELSGTTTGFTLAAFSLKGCICGCQIDLFLHGKGRFAVCYSTEKLILALLFS